MPPKMKVDFFHFFEEVDPLWDEMEASSSAKIGSSEIGFMIFLLMLCQVSNVLRYRMKNTNCMNIFHNVFNLKIELKLIAHINWIVFNTF